MTRLDEIEARLAGVDLTMPKAGDPPVQVDPADLRWLLNVARAAEAVDKEWVRIVPGTDKPGHFGHLYNALDALRAALKEAR